MRTVAPSAQHSGTRARAGNRTLGLTKLATGVRGLCALCAGSGLCALCALCAGSGLCALCAGSGLCASVPAPVSMQDASTASGEETAHVHAFILSIIACQRPGALRFTYLSDASENAGLFCSCANPRACLDPRLPP